MFRKVAMNQSKIFIKNDNEKRRRGIKSAFYNESVSITNL